MRQLCSGLGVAVRCWVSRWQLGASALVWCSFSSSRHISTHWQLRPWRSQRSSSEAAALRSPGHGSSALITTSAITRVSMLWSRWLMSWQSVVKPRVEPRAVRRPADKARRGSILNIFDRGATLFSRDASPLECSGAFATGCLVYKLADGLGVAGRKLIVFRV